MDVIAAAAAVVCECMCVCVCSRWNILMEVVITNTSAKLQQSLEISPLAERLDVFASLCRNTNQQCQSSEVSLASDQRILMKHRISPKRVTLSIVVVCCSPSQCCVVIDD